MPTIVLTDDASTIIDRLHGAGYECYAVGGCVRDCLLGMTPHDWDFATSALPDEIERVFSDLATVDVGKRYGTIAVLLGGHSYEVTTYRVDGDYTDARHPDEVRFSPCLRDDLSRRDFTVNAMAYDPTDGLYDAFDGERDLRYRVIRCVGDPTQRFGEDALRVLRALRFSSVLGFSIEPATERAIFSCCDRLSDIAPERLMRELLRLLCGDNVSAVLRRYRSVIAAFIPELSGTFDFAQNTPHHNRDVYKHIVASVKNIAPDPVLRTTMLFHDIGKPMSLVVDRRGISHFKGHPMLSAAMSEEILRRLCCSNNFIDDVCTLIRYHDERLTPDPPMLKRYLKTLGERRMRMLLSVQRADILAQSMYLRQEKLSTLSQCEQEVERILSSGECYRLSMLEVNGRDILHLGVSAGVRIGELLDEVLDKVIDGELLNDRDALLSYLRQRI